MAQIEFKNAQTETAIMRILNPQPVKQLPVKIAYQKFKGGKAVLTVYTRD
jgi:hypothetical protein